MIKPDQTVFDVQFDAFMARPELSRHLGDMVFRALAKRPFRKIVVDLTSGRTELNCGTLLAVATVLSRRWKDRIPEKRVGVVFPAGLGGILTNLALMLADKVPVNFNFTAGYSALEASIEKAEVKTIITAKPVIDKVGEFPWTEHRIDLIEERKGIDKKEIVKWLAAIVALPSGVLAKKLGIPREGGAREAGLLFSSGSTGQPKGIALSHRNIIGNCLQIVDCGLLNPKERMMANLPIFHSFGFTVNLWYPLLTGLKIVTLPSPLETKRVAEAIEQEDVTVMMGTPTFYRPYFKRARPEQLQSLKFVVAGAEKTPQGFGKKWEEHFGSGYLEGYGLTETSPVVCCNLPAEAESRYLDVEERRRTGSVGLLFPGMKAMLADPATLEPRPLLKRGMLCLQGVNVFSGYLDDPEETENSFHDDWFVTGDLARFDEDGFLYIEGRVRRFSKIGGEMVPHGTVEQAVARAFDLEDSERPVVAVTGVTNTSKGESLILLTTVDIDAGELREKLTAEGLPNLWIPRQVKRVETIPCLASGKLDLSAMEKLARDGQ